LLLNIHQYYVSLIHKATSSSALVTLAEQSANNASQTDTSPFGNVTVPWPADKGGMTMAAAAAMEWGVLEALLKKVLGGAVGSSGA